MIDTLIGIGIILISIIALTVVGSIAMLFIGAPEQEELPDHRY
jgi:hypothetical protein